MELEGKMGSQERLPEDFFWLDGKVCFIGTNSARIEATREKYKEARSTALSEYGRTAPILVDRRIQILLGDQVKFVDKINFTSVDTFPEDLDLRLLLAQHLSWDAPHARLSEDEAQKLQQGLAAIGKPELFNLKIEK